MNDEYELKVLKSVALKLIDEIVESNKNDLDSLKISREEIVFDIARKIYTQGGRKIPFSEIRDLFDPRIKMKEKSEARKRLTTATPQNPSIRDGQIEIDEKLAAKQIEIRQNIGKFGGDEETTRVFLRVRKTISEQIGVEEEEVNLECHLSNHLGADDLDMVELIMALEEEFGIEISDEVVDSRLGISPNFSFSSWGSGSSPSSSCGAGPECVVRNFVSLICEITGQS